MGLINRQGIEASGGRAALKGTSHRGGVEFRKDRNPFVFAADSSAFLGNVH